MRKSIAFLGMVLAGSVSSNVFAADHNLLSPQLTTRQTFSGQTTVDRSIITNAVTSPADAAPSSALPVVEFSAASARLISFEQHGHRLRLDGESDVARLTFRADAREAGSGGKLRLAYRNAVSVMPEASMVSVSVNGANIGDFPVRSPSGFKFVDLVVPPAVLKTGTNEVVVRGVQHHRVDCSMEATYELWTEFDNQHSGFLPRATSPFGDFASLRTVGHTADGVTELRLVLPRDAGIDAVNQALPLIQALSLLLNRHDITVNLAETPGSGPGIDVLIGVGDQPQSLSQIPRDAPAGISVRTGGDAQRAAVILRAGSANQIPTILLQAIQTQMKSALDEGVRVGQVGVINAEPRKTYQLSETGYVSSPFAGRLFRSGFEINLPADFYPAEYATIDLGLHAATSPGLKATSQLLVRVNGQIVKSLPMRDPDGEVFSGRRIELPLRAFHPGRNQIELLAELERTDDDACTYADRDDVSPRFILLGTTDISVPALARVARMPELAATVGTGWPYAGTAPLSVHTVQPDARSVSAAMSMVARLSLAAGEPLSAKLAIGLPDNKAESRDGNTLVIASKRAIEDYQRMGAAHFNAEPATIQYVQAWSDPDQIMTSAIGIDPAALKSVTVDPSALLQAFRDETRQNGSSSIANISDRLSQGFSDFLKWLNYQRPAAIAPFNTNARLANITQGPTIGGKGVVTWLTAETPLDLSDATVALADPTIWYRMEGEKTTLNIDTAEVRTEIPADYFDYRLNEYGPGNLRRIAAAWLSDHFRIYVVLTLGLMAIFAVWIGRAVPRNGVRSDK